MCFRESLSIGRDESNDLVLNDDRVSRNHALIRKQGADVVLVDLGSSNGTFLNGRPVGGPHTLQESDRLEIGGCAMSLVLDEPTPGAEVVPAAPAEVTARAFTNRSVCILVSDIRNFTPLSAAVTAEALPPIITRWFRLAGDLIQEHDGVIEKFRGDSVMAFWTWRPNADDEGQVVQAVQAARAVVARSRVYAQEVASRLSGQTFSVGCGLHVGKAVLGNIGTDSRRDITMLGDCVNVAFRIESQCAALGESIVFSRAVHEIVAGSIDTKSLGAHALKGKDDALELFSVRA